MIRLGTTTATDDTTGATVATSEAWRGVDRGRVEEALAGFRGAYDQRPPAYSAVKVAGERAYRRGGPRGGGGGGGRGGAGGGAAGGAPPPPPPGVPPPAGGGGGARRPPPARRGGGGGVGRGAR